MRSGTVFIKSTNDYVQHWEWVEETMTYTCNVCGEWYYNEERAIKCCRKEKDARLLAYKKEEEADEAGEDN